jgi:hypothetical protein
MPFSEVYRRQAALVVRVLPEVAREECFALKGGTGINLFIRDMPRLSVDIDLTYLPVQGREQSLAAIDAAMRRIEQGIKKEYTWVANDARTAPPRRHRDKTTGACRRRADKDRSDAGSARLCLPGRTPRSFFKC